MSPEKVVGLILTALDDGVTLDMLTREELREEYRDLLLKYKLIRIKWGRTILTWGGIVFIKLIKKIQNWKREGDVGG